MKKRTLRPEERQLWAKIASTVTPRPGRYLPAPEPEVEQAVRRRPADPPAPKSKEPAPRIARGSKAPPQDASGEKRVRRGRVEIDGKIDLHGMTQDEAHAALVGFLPRLAAAGGRCGLVITGKGRLGAEGVLRRRLPDWLATPPLAGLVATYAPAHARHGGEGAWYVFIRRSR